MLGSCNNRNGWKPDIAPARKQRQLEPMPNAIQPIYDALVDELGKRASLALISARYFPQIFGNFIISFTICGHAKSLVNEWFELLLCDRLGGEGNRRTVVKDIREQSLLEILESVEQLL